jgi:hypothetical protein
MLCRKLTNLGARTQAGKLLSVEIGEEPTTDIKKYDVFGILPKRSEMTITATKTAYAISAALKSLSCLRSVFVSMPRKNL